MPLLLGQLPVTIFVCPVEIFPDLQNNATNPYLLILNMMVDYLNSPSKFSLFSSVTFDEKP